MTAKPNRDVRRYDLLLRAGRRFNEVVELQPLLFSIRDFVCEAVGADSVGLMWLGSGGATVQTLMHGNEVRADEVEGVGAPTPRDGPIHEALTTRVASHRTGAGTVQVTLPLVRGGEVCGLMEVGRADDSGRFTEEDIELLNALGEDIVVSISNSFLYEKVLRISEENRLLYAISRDVGATLDVEELIDRLLDHLRLIVPYNAAGLYLNRPGDAVVAWLGHRGYPEGSSENIRLKLGEGIVGQVASSGRPKLVPDVADDDDYVAARAETRSEMVVPLLGSAGEVIGAFNVESDRADAFSTRDLERLESFASLAAVAIERESSRRLRQEKRRLDRELALARRIQEAFQPRRAPEIPGFQVWGRQLPSIEMSGDYFDVIRISDNDYGIVIADVSGKGVPAALIMASLRAALISEVRSRYAIRRVVSEVNRLLLESTEAQGFATVFYGVISVQDCTLTFVNAGHDPPILRASDGTLRHLVTGGTILGAFPDVEFGDERIQLEPGDTIVLYTDGITEARDRNGEFFGLERVEALLAEPASREPRQIGEDLFAAVATFAGDGPPSDDQTLLVVQVDSEDE